jgi:hypothetical protein
MPTPSGQTTMDVGTPGSEYKRHSYYYWYQYLQQVQQIPKAG